MYQRNEKAKEGPWNLLEEENDQVMLQNLTNE